MNPLLFHKDNSNGVTMTELLVVISIIVFLVLSVTIVINPVELQSRARDEKRLSDMLVLDQAINEYKLDNASYPDSVDTTRNSTALPVGNSGPLQNPTDGWINVDLVAYVTELPTDPTNDSTYRYLYRHTTFTYELNAVLEYYSDLMVDDGGDDSGVYELGNDLTIL